MNLPPDDSDQIGAMLDAQWDDRIEVVPNPDSPETYDFVEF